MKKLGMISLILAVAGLAATGWVFSTGLAPDRLYELTAYEHFDLGLAVIGAFAACLVSCALGWCSFETTVSGLAASYVGTLLVLFWLGALAFFLLVFSSPMPL